MTGVPWILQQRGDQLAAFVGSLVGQKGADLTDLGDTAEQIEGSAAQELSIVRSGPRVGPCEPCVPW